MEWQKDIDEETDVDESTEATKDGEAKAPIAGSVVQEMSLQKGKILPVNGETGTHPKRVEILWNGHDATEYLSSRPTHVGGRVLTGDAQTCIVDDPRDIPLSFLVTLWWPL